MYIDAILFVNKKQLEENEKNQLRLVDIEIKDYEEFYDYLGELSVKSKVFMDLTPTN